MKTTVKKILLISLALCCAVYAQKSRQAGSSVYEAGHSDYSQVENSAYDSGQMPVQNYQQEQQPEQAPEPAPAPAFAPVANVVQGKPKIAVYVSDHYGYSQDEKSALKTATQTALVKSGKYLVVERSSVVDEVQAEMARGHVDDDQMVAFGRQAGAKYVCVSDMTQFGTTRQYWRECSNSGNSSNCWTNTKDYSDYQVSARIIDVETAELVALGVVNATGVESGAALTNTVKRAVEEMLNTVSSTQTTPNIPKMAVYIQGGNARNSIGSVLYTFVQDALFIRSKSSGEFKVIERSEAINKELSKQTSGSVDDGQIIRMGRQYGIGRILVANVEYAKNTYNISARIIDIESAAIMDASEIRHFYENPPSRDQQSSGTVSTLLDLRLKSTGIVEDMIKRKLTQAELEAERVEEQIAAEKDEELRMGWSTAFSIGGGMLMNMNTVDSIYTSTGGIFSVGFEFYKGSLSFFRLGFNYSMAGTGVDRPAIRNIRPDAESIKTGIMHKGDAFAKINIADVLYAQGGIGYFTNSYEFKGMNGKVESRVSALEYPVGGGLSFGLSDGAIFFIEGLYHIVPDRSANFIAVMAGWKMDVGRIEADEAKKKREAKKRMEELKRKGS